MVLSPSPGEGPSIPSAAKEYPHGGCQHGQIDFDAFSRLGEGLEDWHVAWRNLILLDWDILGLGLLGLEIFDKWRVLCGRNFCDGGVFFSESEDVFYCFVGG